MHRRLLGTLEMRRYTRRRRRRTRETYV